MKLTFLGTRGNLDIATPRHRRHTATLVTTRESRVMIDCGEDWLGRLQAIGPAAIVLTHAHPDHAGGLAEGAPCPVYATAATWERLAVPVQERRIIAPGRTRRIGRTRFRAFPVQHSILAPAVGYRITAGGITVFYAPDLVAIRDRAAAFRGIRLYVGDGATVSRPLIRRRGRALIGHAPISTQIRWCGKEGVLRAIFTHCGSEVLKADGRRLRAVIRAMGREAGVDAGLAHDGMVIVLR